MKLREIKRYLSLYLPLIILLFVAGACLSTPESGCNLPTSSSSILYGGVYSSEVRTLLSKTTPWQTPACDGGTDFQFPRSFAQLCIRDQYVEAAIKSAFAAEYKWRAGKQSEAENYATIVRQTLNSADALCSNSPTVCSTCDCSTKDIWPCPTTSGNTTPTTPTPAGKSAIAFKNNVFTPVMVTYNGVTKQVDPGQTTSFDGTPGVVGSFHAETSGKTAQGTQVGILIPWDYTYTFPNSGTFTISLNLAPQSFYLYVTNQSVRKITKLYVNYGLQSQTADNITIPNDKQRYGVGYYRAYTNSNLRLEGENNWVWTWASPDFKLDFVENQSYKFTAY